MGRYQWETSALHACRMGRNRDHPQLSGWTYGFGREWLAKEAAELGSSNLHQLPQILHEQLPISLSAKKQHIGKQTNRAKISWWRSTKQYRHIGRIDPRLLSVSFIRATEDLNCRQTSVLTQLQTGHIPLNKYLYRGDSPYCQHCPPHHRGHWPLLIRLWQIHTTETGTHTIAQTRSILQAIPSIQQNAMHHTLNYSMSTQLSGSPTSMAISA